ncbi:MFS transporter [Nonomuraea angiospora]|uniref:MFS transporter n=1 Tax=Nonomuraea angiospora TaxID=46172 RepID=UPI00344D0321
MGYFVILLDNSVIFAGLASIRADPDLSPGVLSWVQDAYPLAFLGARAGDLLGRRRLFVAGPAIFGIASLLIGLAPAGWWIVAARALQGIGAPTSPALITAHFEGRERARAVAWYGATGPGSTPWVPCSPRSAWALSSSGSSPPPSTGGRRRSPWPGSWPAWCCSWL